MSEEKREKERREEAERRSEEERRQALADWDGRDWQPDSDAGPENDKRQNARRQTVLEQRIEDRRKS